MNTSSKFNEDTVPFILLNEELGKELYGNRVRIISIQSKRNPSLLYWGQSTLEKVGIYHSFYKKLNLHCSYLAVCWILSFHFHCFILIRFSSIHFTFVGHIAED